MRRHLPLLLVALAACEGDASSLDARATPTDDERFLVEIDAPDALVAGTDLTFRLHITDAAGDPALGLDVEVEPWMPGHGHGIANNPEVDAQGDGTYNATFAFNMPGSWELRLTLDDGEATSRVVFSYEVD